MDQENQNSPKKENPENQPAQETIEFDAGEVNRLNEQPEEFDLTDFSEGLFEEPENPDDPADPPEDPLENAEELPDLFPDMEDPPVPEEPFFEGEPTIVPRPERKKKSTGRKVALVFRSIFKWLIALVLAVAILAAGLIGYLTVAEYHPAYSEETRHGGWDLAKPYKGEEISLLTFNTGHGGLGQDADSFWEGGETVTAETPEEVFRNMEGIAKILGRSKADFLFLQEVDLDSRRSFEENQWIRYEQSLQGYESRFALDDSCKFVPYPIKDVLGKIHSGIATYSRYEIGASTRYSLPNPLPWPERILERKPCFTLTRIPTGTQEENKPELVLLNLHLEDCEDDEARRAQMEAILTIMQEEYDKGNYVIAGGDFDQTFPGAREYPLRSQDTVRPNVLDRLGGGWRYVFDDSVPTCRLADQPYDPYTAQCFVTDGFIVSPNVQVLSVETLDEGFTYSSHNPVLLRVQLT